MATITIDTAAYNDDQRTAFISGYKATGGYMGDMDSVDAPWCAPWTWGNPTITVPADCDTPEKAGAAHWQTHKAEIESLLAEEAAMREQMEEEPF